MSIEVLEKEDGLWLSFHCKKTGNSALLGVEALVNECGPITGRAVNETCQEIADNGSY
ncbi:hypothetical protein KA005_17800 [bacterium]|nr:hypothetical protein [bacterium]